MHLFIFCSWVTRSHVLILYNYLLSVGRLQLINFYINIVINQQFNVKWNFNYDACSVPCMTRNHHIVQIVCGGEHWWTWWIDFDLPKFCLAKFYCQFTELKSANFHKHLWTLVFVNANFKWSCKPISFMCNPSDPLTKKIFSRWIELGKANVVISCLWDSHMR